jgi:hypothetical protein
VTLTADELHDLAVHTRDAARLAERHGTSVHGYRRAAREACEHMGEMAADIEPLRENFLAAMGRLRAAERERDAARLAIRTIRDAMGCTPGEDPAERAEFLVATVLRVAQAVGVVYSADHRAEEAGPADEVVGAVRQLARERDEAEAQLAALREAAGPHAASEYASDSETRVLRIALTDAAPAAEAHDRRVRAEALRWEADRWSDPDDDVPRRLRASADEIERGER